MAALGLPVWTPLPNPPPLWGRELTAIAETSMLHCIANRVDVTVYLISYSSGLNVEVIFQYSTSRHGVMANTRP